MAYRTKLYINIYIYSYLGNKHNCPTNKYNYPGNDFTIIQEIITIIKEIPTSWSYFLAMRRIPDRCIGLQGPLFYAQTMRNLCASVRMQIGCISDRLGLETRVRGAAVSISYAPKRCSYQTAVETPSGRLAKLDW